MRSTRCFLRRSPYGLLFAFHRAFQARPRIAAYIASGRRPAAFGIVIDGVKLDPRLAAMG